MLTRLRLTAITVRPKTTPGCAAASAITDRQENFPGLGVNRPAAWRRRFFNWGRRQGPAGEEMVRECFARLRELSGRGLSARRGRSAPR